MCHLLRPIGKPSKTAKLDCRLKEHNKCRGMLSKESAFKCCEPLFQVSSSSLDSSLIHVSDTTTASTINTGFPSDHECLVHGEELQQPLFHGLVFYFIPNSTVSGARRRRMEAIRQNGGIVTDRWVAGVSHIIADQHITGEYILHAMRWEQAPACVAVVNEFWAPECLMYGRLQDPSKGKYVIEGLVSQTPSKHSSSSAQSLQLRPQQGKLKRKVSTSSLLSIESGPIPQPPVCEEARFEAKGVDTVPLWQKGFACMMSTEAKESNPNAFIIEILQQLCDYYAQEKDEWRTISYRKAITQLKHTKHAIESAEDALAIRGIGDRLATKIAEIVQTGKLEKLEHSKQSSNVLAKFLRIHGVGFAQAQKWIAMGITTLDDVMNRGSPSLIQQIGLRYYDDFCVRIPRAEVNDHAEVVRLALSTVEPMAELLGPMGSYRRGEETCGDVRVSCPPLVID